MSALSLQPFWSLLNLKIQLEMWIMLNSVHYTWKKQSTSYMNVDICLKDKYFANTRKKNCKVTLFESKEAQWNNLFLQNQTQNHEHRILPTADVNKVKVMWEYHSRQSANRNAGTSKLWNVWDYPARNKYGSMNTIFYMQDYSVCKNETSWKQHIKLQQNTQNG